MEPERRVVILGGGAAGMVAAISARRAGAAVTVLEKGERVGRKLLATGNGRCNLTNLDLSPSRFHGCHPGFSDSVLDRFGACRVLAFFQKLGIAVVVEEKGRVFPRAGQASAVLDALRWEMGDLGVDVRCGVEVQAIRPGPDGFRILVAGSSPVLADRIILATGGRAAPALGADDSGLALAAALGHRVVPPFPALASLRLASPWLRHLQGARLSATLAARSGGALLCESNGEVLFTEHGVSGPAVLDLSRRAAQAVLGGQSVELALDIVPESGADEVAWELDRRLDGRPDRPLSAALVGWVNKRLVVPLLRTADLPELDGPAGSLSPGQRSRLARLLKDWSFPVAGPGPWPAAQVAAGGVDTDDVCPDTLESRRVPGLLFAGEVLDVDGDCGGYNLQWAWASGLVAGEVAARGNG